jgi:Flp pilus assembly pilin Flp
MEKVKKFFSDESGNATEYGLIIALVSVAIIAGATYWAPPCRSVQQCRGTLDAAV